MNMIFDFNPSKGAVADCAMSLGICQRIDINYRMGIRLLPADVRLFIKSPSP
jgi:hypothetical protein